MSLDIAILDEQGIPAEGVAVTSDSHFQLMQQAKALSLRQFSRMHDYYQDVDYTVQETLLLQQEAETLVRHCAGKQDFCRLVDTIQNLVRHAVNDEKAVAAIAD
jgi:hypothetical protein